MEKILTNGERIWKSLLNPSSKDIAASEWLLLFTIYKNNNIRSRDVSEKLSENWKKVHAENPNFYVIWSTGFETDKELKPFLENPFYTRYQKIEAMQSILKHIKYNVLNPFFQIQSLSFDSIFLRKQP